MRDLQLLNTCETCNCVNGMAPRQLQGIVSLPRCLDGGPIDGPVDCGDPSRRELDGKKVSHGASWTRAQHLCRGMRMLQDASCAQLSNTSFLQEVIQTTGVTYDPRKRDLYGDAAQFMIRTSTGQKIGLWQDPSQFAAAMAYHGSSRHEIRSYIEVGCYTGWTALILTTYLQRIGHRVRGYLIDLNPTAIGPVMPLLARRNLTFRRRSELPEDKMEMVERAARGRQRAFDLCFIDAQHSYAGVKEDYGEFAPHCRSAMFHDIQDIYIFHDIYICSTTSRTRAPGTWGTTRAACPPSGPRSLRTCARIGSPPSPSRSRPASRSLAWASSGLVQTPPPSRTRHSANGSRLTAAAGAR